MRRELLEPGTGGGGEAKGKVLDQLLEDACADNTVDGRAILKLCHATQALMSTRLVTPVWALSVSDRSFRLYGFT